MSDNSFRKKVLLAVGGASMTVAGFMVIPALLDKYGSKIYKASLDNDEIDFENMGPEIVKKEEEETQEKASSEEE